MRLSFGRPVDCQDGSFGELADVVIDPATMRLTHLITSPPAAKPRLIPIELAEAGEVSGEVTLRCTLAATENLPSVLEYRNLASTEDPEPGDRREWDEGVEHVVAMPYDGIGIGLGQYDGVEASLNVSYDRVPKGSAELRHASAIVTADGHYLGGVEGFRLDDSGRLTDVVLDESHFWSRREIAIPIDAVQALETDTVTVALSSAEVAQLPAVRVRRWF
jgi:sporulation protein YlmC with PRC-barrel domain